MRRLCPVCLAACLRPWVAGSGILYVHRAAPVPGNVPAMWGVGGCVVGEGATSGARCPCCDGWAVEVVSITPTRRLYVHRIVRAGSAVEAVGCLPRPWWVLRAR